LLHGAPSVAANPRYYEIAVAREFVMLTAACGALCTSN